MKYRKYFIGFVLVPFCIVNQQNNVKQIQKYNIQVRQTLFHIYQLIMFYSFRLWRIVCSNFDNLFLASLWYFVSTLDCSRIVSIVFHLVRVLLTHYIACLHKRLLLSQFNIDYMSSSIWSVWSRLWRNRNFGLKPSMAPWLG